MSDQNPENYDEGWVDPVETQPPWTLLDAMLRIQSYAYQRAARDLQNTQYRDDEDFHALVRKHTRDMWNQAESLLKAEYPHLDFEQFSFELQDFAVYGDEEGEEEEEATEENGWELIPEEGDDVVSDSPENKDIVPSMEDLNDWWNL